MTLISSGVGKRPVNQHDELSNRRCSWCKPRWLQGRREADELARWATEVMWQWNDTTDNANWRITPSCQAKLSTISQPKRTTSRRIWMSPRSVSPHAATDLLK
jgi:hypothetical protein